MKFNFIKPTLNFVIAGFIIPGFTAIGLLGLQILLTNSGVECSKAWGIIWTITSIAGVILPFAFYQHIKTLQPEKLNSLNIKLLLFNFFEYIFIQASLSSLMTDGQTLCYVTDGQNGLELAFSAWLALPILIIFSFIFNETFKKTFRKEEEI